MATHNFRDCKIFFESFLLTPLNCYFSSFCYCCSWSSSSCCYYYCSPPCLCFLPRTASLHLSRDHSLPRDLLSCRRAIPIFFVHWYRWRDHLLMCLAYIARTLLESRQRGEGWLEGELYNVWIGPCLMYIIL